MNGVAVIQVTEYQAARVWVIVRILFDYLPGNCCTANFRNAQSIVFRFYTRVAGDI